MSLAFDNIDDSVLEKNVIVCENLVKIYKTKDIEVLALQGLELLIEKGELMAIIGNSGSGKSTLLNMIGGLDRPSAGRLYVDGKDLFKLDEKELVEYKRSTVGFVWQNNARNLIPYLSALENIMMPMDFNKSTNKNGDNSKTPDIRSVKHKKERARMLLELTGLESKRKSKLSQLSGGEQQRIAIALALANSPRVLLADEPTGSVDTRTSDLILDIFRNINKELGTTIIIVTHDRQLSKKVNRVVSIRDGKTSSEMILKQNYADRLSHISGFGEEDAAVDQRENEHEEFAVLDRAGRVQIPKEFLDKIGLQGNKIKLEEQDGRIIISAPGRGQ